MNKAWASRGDLLPRAEGLLWTARTLVAHFEIGRLRSIDKPPSIGGPPGQHNDFTQNRSPGTEFHNVILLYSITHGSEAPGHVDPTSSNFDSQLRRPSRQSRGPNAGRVLLQLYLTVSIHRTDVSSVALISR